MWPLVYPHQTTRLFLALCSKSRLDTQPPLQTTQGRELLKAPLDNLTSVDWTSGMVGYVLFDIKCTRLTCILQAAQGSATLAKDPREQAISLFSLVEPVCPVDPWTTYIKYRQESERFFKEISTGAEDDEWIMYSKNIRNAVKYSLRGEENLAVGVRDNIAKGVHVVRCSAEHDGDYEVSYILSYDGTTYSA